MERKVKICTLCAMSAQGAAEYLERYAPDFIEDYTERYAKGDFTEAELLWMETNHYRGTYIVDIAKQYQ